MTRRSSRSEYGNYRKIVRYRRKNKKKRVLLSVLIVLVSAFLIILATYFFAVKREVTIEYGQKLDAASFKWLGFGNVELLNAKNSEIFAPGKYEISVKLAPFTYSCKLIVLDTTPPSVNLKSIDMGYGKEVLADEFIESAEDLSDYSVSYVNTPDWGLVGVPQKISISVKDEWGNETVKDTELFIQDFPQIVEVELGSKKKQVSELITAAFGEVEYPEISDESIADVGVFLVTLTGNNRVYSNVEIHIVDTLKPEFTEASDFESFLGENIIYREKVSVSDNSPKEPEIKVDAKAVNINEEGVYPVTYTAIDPSGNESSITINVTIREKTEKEKELQEKVTAILGNIIKDGMSKKEQADAIYNYIYNHITYVSRPKGDFVEAALEGISGRGGCFNYASLAMFMFNELGIKNMFMETEVHYWNIIDIDDGHGWYHFDATPSPELPKIFLWDDAKMMAYSSAHGKTHHYDKNIYPHIP